jgi:lipopolysaccharide/colanic/teichoic acid biosynthesis glycosyltransferase
MDMTVNHMFSDAQYAVSLNTGRDTSHRQTTLLLVERDSSPVQQQKVQRLHARFAAGSHKTTMQIRWQLLLHRLRHRLEDGARRLFDLIVAVLALAGVSPLMLITAIAVRLESEGPIIFQQRRVGRFGESFTIYKFRSMYSDAEQLKAQLLALNSADEIVFKMKEDPRVTRSGRIIRRLSIDELPQLFNVIRGDMRLVGPRPAVPEEVSSYPYDYFRRLEALPGMTGLQQVSGRSDLTFKQWVELDLQYVEEQSLLKDLAILLKTIPVVLSRRGAY